MRMCDSYMRVVLARRVRCLPASQVSSQSATLMPGLAGSRPSPSLRRTSSRAGSGAPRFAATIMSPVLRLVMSSGPGIVLVEPALDVGEHLGVLAAVVALGGASQPLVQCSRDPELHFLDLIGHAPIITPKLGVLFPRTKVFTPPR